MKRWFVLLIATLCLGVASAGGAQIASGNIYGTVSDAQGGVLPGATVSARPPTASVNGICTLTPVLTMTSRACFVNPGSSTITV